MDCRDNTWAADLPSISDDDFIIPFRSEIKLQHILGRGKYSTVYSGIYNKTQCAVKISYVHIDCFLQEISMQEKAAACNLGLPVLHTEYSERYQIGIIVMPLFRGDTLEEVFKRLIPHELGVIVDLTIRVLQMMYHLVFRCGINHTDLYLRNIMYDRDTDRLVFLDFGNTAEITDTGANLTSMITKLYAEIGRFRWTLPTSKQFRILLRKGLTTFIDDNGLEALNLLHLLRIA